jgi:hypothetical protein
VIVQSNLGRLYTVEADTGMADLIELTGGSGNVVQGDGILLDGRMLYVVQNRMNQIAVIKLTRGLASGTITGLLTDSDFDVPTTIAEFGKYLYAVNARFGVPNPATQPFSVVRVER